MKTVFIAIAVSLLAGAFPQWAKAQQSTTSPREQLQQYVAQLQSNPSDQDLREKIIKLALTIKPAPAIPDKDKVLELEGEAKGALKAAQSQTDYSDAVKLFQKALLLAPWNADLNYNLAKAQEMAKQYDDAIASYKLYLLTAPEAKDKDAVLEKIGELKYEGQKREEEQAQAQSPARQAASSPSPSSQSLRLPDAVTGEWHSYRLGSGCDLSRGLQIEAEGNQVRASFFPPYAIPTSTYGYSPPGLEVPEMSWLGGRSFQLSYRFPNPNASYGGWWSVVWELTLSPDGNTLYVTKESGTNPGGGATGVAVNPYMFKRKEGCPATGQ